MVWLNLATENRGGLDSSRYTCHGHCRTDYYAEFDAGAATRDVPKAGTVSRADFDILDRFAARALLTTRTAATPESEPSNS